MLCDGSVVDVVVDEQGKPVSVGTMVRVPSPKMQRAVGADHLDPMAVRACVGATSRAKLAEDCSPLGRLTWLATTEIPPWINQDYILSHA